LSKRRPLWLRLSESRAGQALSGLSLLDWLLRAVLPLGGLVSGLLGGAPFYMVLSLSMSAAATAIVVSEALNQRLWMPRWLTTPFRNRNELNLALYAPHLLSDRWDPLAPGSPHKIHVVTFPELSLTNRSEQDMVVELAFLPLGRGILHIHQDRVAVPSLTHVTLRNLVFRWMMWTADRPKPEIDLDNLALIARDHLSGKRRVFRYTDLFGGSWSTKL
jgi:hypothetical protein